MAKSSPFTLANLEKKGFIRSADGSYSKSKGDYETAIGVIKSSIASKKIVGDIVAKQPVINTPNFVFTPPLESFLVIDGIVAGLNGSNGLMRSHWYNTKRQKDLYRQIIKDHLKSNKVRKHEGKVRVQYIGYKSSFMDWDNFAASFKFLGDSLVKEKIVVDDSPKYVVEFIPKQIKCKRKDQKVIVIIQDI